MLPLNPRESRAFFLQRILAEKRAYLQAEAVLFTASTVISHNESCFFSF